MRALDVAFILDPVVKINPAMWNQVVKLIKSVLMRLDVNVFGTHVAVMTYNNGWSIVKSLSGEMSFDLMFAKSADVSARNINSAIRLARLDIFSQSDLHYVVSGDRPDVPDVVVIVVGAGLSSNSTTSTTASEAAESAGIKIVTVGVGPNVDVDDLKDIATNATEAELLHAVAPENVTALLPTLLECIRDLVVDVPDLGK